ncbi:MAG: hypothetical protein Q8928_00415 [Bacteroidota bacterium]|nr:hypothetical protein [Bacteroidota bacterium]
MRIKIKSEVPLQLKKIELVVEVIPQTNAELKSIINEEFIKNIALIISNMGYMVLEFVERQGTDFTFIVQK